VQFEKDPYQGIASAMPATAAILNGLSRGLARHGTAAKAWALYLLFSPCLKACPDACLA
jgi:hypothetical protein